MEKHKNTLATLVMIGSFFFSVVCLTAELEKSVPDNQIHDEISFALKNFSHSYLCTAVVLLNIGMIVVLPIIYLINAYIKKSFDIKTWNSNGLIPFLNWELAPGAKKPNSVFLKRLYFTLMFLGIYGVIVGVLPIIIGHAFASIIKALYKGLVRLFKAILCIPKTMAERNREYLDQHPEKAAKLLKKRLPDSTQFSNKPRL